MTYMPNFTQSALDFSNDDYINLEAKLLRERCRQNLSRILLERELSTSVAVYTARLEAELQIIDDKKCSSYFLIVADYVRWAEDNGIAVGPGRGSGPCSLVGFVLGITKVDPVKYNLPFERFVNPERNAVPDFDIDFCEQRCGEVIAYIQTRYGSGRVAQISSDDGTPLPSRLVIGDRPLTELIALYSNPASGFPATRLTIAQVANAGLVQFNVIPQKALTLIQKATKALNRSGTAVDFENMNHKATYHLLSRGVVSNIGVFDSAQYQSALLTIKPEEFKHLCAAIALSHPLLKDRIKTYAESRHNPDYTKTIHPDVTRITAESYGHILYQEQIILIAEKISGYSLAEADTLRRTLKASTPETDNPHKKRFINGAQESGLSQTQAIDLFEQIASACRCSFNKSHAVASAMMEYQLGWLRANTTHTTA